MAHVYLSPGTTYLPGPMDQVWLQWQPQSVATTGTLYDPWLLWQAQGTQGSMYPQNAYPQNAVWGQWQTLGVAGTGSVMPAPIPLTPEQKAVQKRNAFIRSQRTRTGRLRRNIANRKAEDLLITHLSEEQRTEWSAGKSFHVETADGRRRYKIAYGLAGNVRLVKCEGEPPMGKRGPVREGARFCMHVYHPDGPVPTEDNVLAQKLLLEANEAHFLSLANVG